MAWCFVISRRGREACYAGRRHPRDRRTVRRKADRRRRESGFLRLPRRRARDRATARARGSRGGGGTRVSFRLWRRAFDRDPLVLGTVVVNRSLVVIGCSSGFRALGSTPCPMPGYRSRSWIRLCLRGEIRSAIGPAPSSTPSGAWRRGWISALPVPSSKSLRKGWGPANPPGRDPRSTIPTGASPGRGSSPPGPQRHPLPVRWQACWQVSPASFSLWPVRTSRG